MTDSAPASPAAPQLSLEELQHWTWVVGRAQQMMLEFWTEKAGDKPDQPAAQSMWHAWSGASAFVDPSRLADVQMRFWSDSMNLWQRFLDSAGGQGPHALAADQDRRFSAPQWRANPYFDLIRQSYLMMCDHLLGGVDVVEGIGTTERDKLRFATRQFVDAMSPSNFAATNPLVWEKALETKGENLLRGLEHMLRDIGQGQLTQTAPGAFELGHNIATTPGKVVRETPLYQLIQYTPTTDKVLGTPLVIFPPWINRYYILDLSREKSFIRWCVDQGITVFVASWKSADAEMAEVTIDDYVIGGLIDAIDSVRDLIGVESVHTIGYCVAGTNLAAALALLAARGEAGKVATATFFTAQVDFSEAGDLKMFIADDQLKLLGTLSAEHGYLDGRYMAATFNLLRGRDLIWNYVVNNYLLGQDYAPFDLLHWNSDYTNLPAKWLRGYIADLYRDNKLVRPGAITIAGTPIDLTKVKTPSYVQAGREDHIAPAESVWKITEHFKGPIRFVLAGSGHIAGVVNPPDAAKYQHWTNDGPAASLADFIAGATEHKGSWWPDWRAWLGAHSLPDVPAKKARIPGKGKYPAIEDAPGRYVKSR